VARQPFRCLSRIERRPLKSLGLDPFEHTGNCLRDQFIA
jgi:hypothetical protein